MTDQPDSTAVRTALWRALHVLADGEPPVIEDMVGYNLIKPEAGWQRRPDMKYTKRLRASIVARARFTDDMAKEAIRNGAKQYVMLGAGLDSFAQRNKDLVSGVRIFEIDQPATLLWKKTKLSENGYSISQGHYFVPVDFETSSWWDELIKSGFNIEEKTFVSCTGVTLYLTHEAILDTLRKLTLLSAGSQIAIAFYLPIRLLDEEDKPLLEMAIKGAADSGTPFRSFYPEQEIIKIAKDAGLKNCRTVSTKDMTDTYFKNRSDGLIPASGEFFLVAEI